MSKMQKLDAGIGRTLYFTVGLEKTGAMPLRDGGNGLQWRRSVVKYGGQG